MERLTHERTSGIKTGYWSPNKKEELVQRLAEYENTNLDPKQIKEIDDLYLAAVKELGETKKQIERFVPCGACAYCAHEKANNVHWCRLSGALDGTLSLTDGCTRGKKHE